MQSLSFFPRICQIFSWFCKGFLSFQTMPLGVTNPHITLVLYGNWVCSLNFQALQHCIYFILFLCIYLLIYFFFPFSPLLVCFACFCFVAVDFEFICYSPNILVCTFIIIIVLTCSFHFVVGVLIFRWSENKIFYLGVVYKFLSVGMELAVIKELFIILYI